MATKESSYLFDATKTASTVIIDNAISPEGILKNEIWATGDCLKQFFF